MQVYGLIGKKLDYSFSKEYFSRKFESLNLDAKYENFELESIHAMPALLALHPQIAGLNVTIPYKEAVMPLLDHTDPEAAAIGAVNTIAVVNQKLYGYNTDVYGFRESLKPFLAHGMERALVLGTGGAARAVAYVLEKLGVAIYFASRSKRSERTLMYSDLNENVLKACRLIVNATPVGTWPDVDQKPEIPYQFLTPEHFLYDLVYNPSETAFMKSGAMHGAGTTGGITMLKLQAEQSWSIWNKLKN